MTFLRKNLFLFIIIILIVTVFSVKRDIVIEFVKNTTNLVNPCDSPITYSIGSFDNKFAITKQEFLASILQAEKIWEGSANKQLFTYVPAGGTVTINLIYDDRQRVTDSLQKIGIVIEDNKESYNNLKAKYDSLTVNYDTNKKSLENAIALLNVKKEAYETEVNYWNNKGGAPKSEYEKLQIERNEINNEVSAINRYQASLNELADTINSIATAINLLIDKLNLNVNKYNTTRISNGEEFDEGEYIRDAKGQRINIYQFATENKLVRVIAHEFGHALGLQHVSDPKAMMYKLNQSTTEKLTIADINELNKICEIK